MIENDFRSSERILTVNARIFSPKRGSVLNRHSNDFIRRYVERVTSGKRFGGHCEGQWRSQSAADAKAQHGHTMFASSLVPRPRPASPLAVRKCRSN